MHKNETSETLGKIDQMIRAPPPYNPLPKIKQGRVSPKPTLE